MGCGLVVAAVGVGFWVFGSGRAGPMLVLAGVGAFLLVYPLMMRGTPRLRALAVSGLILAVAGAESLFFAPTRLAGTLAMAVGLALLLAGTALYWRPSRTGAQVRQPSAPGRLAALALLLTVVVGVPLGGLGGTSLVLNTSGAVQRHYGQLINVDLPGKCSYTTTIGKRGVRTGNATCDAVWYIDGRRVTGRLVGEVDELRKGVAITGSGLVGTHVDSIRAYAYGDVAYTAAAAAEVGSLAVLSRLSPWSVLGLPIALVAWIVLRRTVWWRGR